MIHYDTLLQNLTDVIKMRQKFIAKCVRFFITKCDSFITKCGSYYKRRRLLQIVTVHAVSKLSRGIKENK